MGPCFIILLAAVLAAAWAIPAIGETGIPVTSDKVLNMCTDCHNVTTGTTGTAHWSHLETTIFEGTPAATIQFSARAAFGVTPTYVGGRCNLTCHTASGEQKTHSSERW